jgi:hypothetical protein
MKYFTMKPTAIITLVFLALLAITPAVYAAEPASIAKASSSIAAAVPVTAGEFKDGDTVCFVGDSITTRSSRTRSSKPKVS